MYNKHPFPWLSPVVFISEDLGNALDSTNENYRFYPKVFISKCM